MAGAEKRRPRRGFGTIRRLPSGRFQATYMGPEVGRHGAPFTFDARGYAERWLDEERRLIELEEWTSPAAREATKRRLDSLTIRTYAAQWLAGRVLRPNTQKDYRHLIEDVILPGLGDLTLHGLMRADVRRWWAALDTSRPRTNAKAYALLRTILSTAVDEEELVANPVLIRGAGVSKRQRTIEPATLPQLAIITDAMPERLRLAVLLGCWCALRYGEMAELRHVGEEIEPAAERTHLPRRERSILPMSGGIAHAWKNTVACSITHDRRHRLFGPTDCRDDPQRLGAHVQPSWPT